MYVLVRLLKGYQKPLHYLVPPHLAALVRKGSVVEVPLRTQKVAALVLEMVASEPEVPHTLREVLGIQQFPSDPCIHSFFEQLASLYFIEPTRVWARLRSFIFSEQATATVEAGVGEAKVAPQLTADQVSIVTSLSADIRAGLYKPTLLQGVTGSGKTEVYKAAMEVALSLGKSVIFLCPEVSLARQLQGVLVATLQHSAPVLGWHSASTGRERTAVWDSAVQGLPIVIVGVHLPVLLPLSNLGLIIVDEEHDGGYEEKQHPRINSKHAALLRARHYNVPIVLGSATPSVATLYHAEQQSWRHSFLTKRFGGEFPAIEHVVLSRDKKRPNFWISRELFEALKDAVFRGQQAILYINRRGYGFFLQCSGCGHTFECGGCAVAMTLHHDEHAGGVERMLECHYCNARRPVPAACVQCGLATDTGKCKGIGTQQIVSILSKLMPEARVARADADISRRKKVWQETIDAFAEGRLDILVGTQIITKGFHFPRVTVVGVIWADSSVHFPVYNAHEVALQQLIQVAGRAGRGVLRGRVIVQSFDNHRLFSYISEYAYPDFCREELAARKEWGYPPFGRLITIEIAHEDEEQVVADAALVKKRVSEKAGALVEVLGPARPLRAKIQGVHYRHVLCKAESYRLVHEAVSREVWAGLKSSVAVSPL